MKGNFFFIPFNTPSSKNGRRVIGNNVVKSYATEKWIRKTKKHWKSQATEFKNSLSGLKTPYYIEFTFITLTRHKFDYNNKADTVLDAMVKHGWLEDDDVTIVKPYYGDWVHNKEEPGVIIKILSKKPKHY